MDLAPIANRKPAHVSVVAIPDAVMSTLTGIFDVMNSFAIMADGRGPHPFRAQIVGEAAGPLTLASRVPIGVERAVDEITSTDIVIVPSILLRNGEWQRGRHPRLVAWVTEMYERGAMLCSACSGLFLLAETGLFDGKDATVHFGYAGAFARTFPAVRIHPDQVLIVSGRREELVTSGASMSWHDLVLYLIARFAGATAAQGAARFFALQWHQHGLTPYIVFEGRTDHGDADIRVVQEWLASNFGVSNPVEQMIERSNLAERTFTRRFTNATGLTPIAYVQRLRIEDAKRRLERTAASAEEVGWEVGYADPAAFRRLFKRTTGLAPGAYRKLFRVPDFGRSDDVN
jgi:transcriptional regulator GlxA family with amidase domain